MNNDNIIEISIIDKSEKLKLQLLLTQYLKELNVSPEYPFFESYWTDANRVPLKIVLSDVWIGFAFINNYTLIDKNNISIAEFYILPEYRRMKYGRFFINHIFKQYKGNWEIRHDLKNTIAATFWGSVLEGRSSQIINHENVYSINK